MVRFDFKKTYCLDCNEKCTHAKTCYKNNLKKLYEEILSKVDLEKELEKSSPQQVANFIKNLGYDVSVGNVYVMMDMKNLKRRTLKEAANSEQKKNLLKKTCLERYGTTNVLSKGTSFYEKRNKTVKDRYGVDNVFQTKEVKEKIRNSIFERFGDYQGFYEYCSKKFKEKYGVENPWMLESVQEKCVNTKLRKYGSINCNNIHFLSSIHQKVSEFFNSLNIEHENENTSLLRFKDEVGKLHWPIPDIHLLNQYSNIIIEVNGDYWHANPAFYKKNDLIRRFDGYVKAQDIWKKDLWRNSNIESLGYKILVVWESEISDGTFCKKILDFLK